ncbi:MAG TPA: NADH-quinone oxidoreductase subunit M [Candidatus Sulfotelmatobacter sp.]|jgi:NADH-quinone oxidoreductase subunit M|nr:NADH-quinone oxidoreductase subunit M [Candidatus Sulfotelmatobacter sp.]
MSILTYIAGWPLLAALALVVVPRNYRVIIRGIAILATAISAGLAIKMFCQFVPGSDGFQFVEQHTWVESLGISYHVGVDGLNVGLILMGAIVGFASTLCAFEIQSREKEFYILLLTMIGGILAAFASLDLFFFYFLHELALVPTFIMIGIWGRGEKKNYATFQITLYLSIGALIALIGLIALYVQSGANSFDIPKIAEQLKANPMSVNAQHYIFPLLLFGFGILVSLWPFHSWAPLGYAVAPSPTSMMHAGVLKKFGLYGLIRIALPLMPQAAHSWMNILAWLCVGNILYVGWVAMRQKDLNLLIGNSSVAHMGFIFLGIASLNLIGVTGAVLIMIAHGFLAALTFALTGYIYRQTGTLQMSELGGLCRKLPFIGTALLMAAMAGCGLPGFANFVGEATVFFGAWSQPSLHVITVIGLWGALVIGGVYMTRAIRTVLHGPLPEKWNTLTDANFWRKLPYALLLASLFVFGIWPRLLTEKINPDVAKIVAVYQPVLAVSAPVNTLQKTAAHKTDSAAGSAANEQLAIVNK